MHDFEFPQDGSSVRCQGHLLQVVNYDFVPAERTEGALDGGRDGPASINISEGCGIFGVVA